MELKKNLLYSLSVSLFVMAAVTSTFASKPIVDDKVVFAEKDGLVAVEAEHFFKQTHTDKRAFYLTTKKETPAIKPDGDPSHVAGASGGAYLEVLPDTRRTHGDKLIRNENFSPQPGKMAILHYKVHIQNPGRYYVWVRAPLNRFRRQRVACGNRRRMAGVRSATSVV